MTAGQEAPDTSFSWPPTTSDLDGVQVLAVQPVGGPAPQAGSLRHGNESRVRIDGSQWRGLLLLGVGMLFGAAMPRLDSAPPARVGRVHAASVAGGLQTPLLLVNASQGRAAARTAPSPDPDVPQRPEAAPTPAGPPAHGTTATLAATPMRAPVSRPLPAPDPRTRQVLAVVRAYERAWSRMDAGATRTVMPSSDVQSLTRTFSALREQRLTLSACRVSGSGARATASCAATLRYRPRKGDHSTRVQHGRWQFQVERAAQRWVITDVDTAGAGRASN